MKEVIVAKSAGFCFGVQRAVDTVYNQCGGKNVFTYGPIIHNEEVVKDLENKGVHVINSADEINDDSTVIIRSHGVSKDVYDSLHEKNVNIGTLHLTVLIFCVILNSYQRKGPEEALSHRHSKEIRNGGMTYDA